MTFYLFTKYLEVLITAADSIILPRSIFTVKPACTCVQMCADKTEASVFNLKLLFV